MTKLSAIVATRNRPIELKRLIESLKQQQVDLEIIVVDQSNPSIAALNRATLGNSPLHHYLHTIVQNTSRARNMGIKIASGQVLCFPDDDCEYLRETVATALIQLADVPLISGQYVDWDGTRSYFPLERCGLQGVGVFGRLSAITFFIRNQGANNILFDERLGGGSELKWSEEIDYAIRYLAQFGQGIYDSALIIRHQVHRASLGNPIARLEQERARGYILAKNLRLLGVSGLFSLIRGIAGAVMRRQIAFVQGIGAALAR